METTNTPKELGMRILNESILAAINVPVIAMPLGLS